LVISASPAVTAAAAYGEPFTRGAVAAAAGPTALARAAAANRRCDDASWAATSSGSAIASTALSVLANNRCWSASSPITRSLFRAATQQVSASA